MATIKTNRSVRLNGLNPLAYVGQNAYTPPDYVIYQRDPTVSDWQDFYVGCIWLNQQYLTDTYNIWMLVGKEGNQALWVQLSTGAGDVLSLSGNTGTNPVFPIAGNIKIFGDGEFIDVSGDGINTLTVSLINGGQFATNFAEDSGFANPFDNTLNVIGGQSVGGVAININTIGSGNTIKICLNNSISQPNTNASATTGMYSLGGFTFLHNYGSGNTFVGQSAGNLTLTTGTATNNFGGGSGALAAITTANGCVAVGAFSLLACTTGELNLAAGVSSLRDLTDGEFNVCLGPAAAQSLLHGDYNTIVGEFAGSNYNNAESYNVIVGSGISGLIGETGIVRIGAQNGTTNTNNTFVGFMAGNSTYTLANAVANTIVGASSGQSITSGTLVNILGANAGTTITSGSRLVVIGSTSGNSLTGNETDSIFILNGGFAGASNTMSIGHGTGTGTYQLNQVFISGIAGITTTVADAVPVLISASTGQLGTVSSSLRYKENIVDMGNISDDIYRLRPVIFNYKKHSTESKSVGLIAEEVVKVMPNLIVHDEEERPETVRYNDLVPMLLNELQKLHTRVAILEKLVQY